MLDKIKTEASEQFKILIDKFEAHKNQYKKSTYDEANTRVDFIDPFFESLGWDVSNKQGYAEQYREVVREDKITILGKHKAPDYSFRIGGIRKFFVEAKKPAVDIKATIQPAYQLRRYAYTAKLPLSILTDFEEFAVYDTRIKPTSKDLASVARIFYCGYKDYLKNFDSIVETFSKEAILKGSFDRYVESTRKKRGTSEVDKEFLKLIDTWREELAKNIALRNKDLTLYELNFAIQKIIDRIIFFRIAEDRQIEDYGTLQILLNGVNTYRRLTQIFLEVSSKYNSSLFDFKSDKITLNLTVDDKILKQIIKTVYYPESPYEFSVLDVEILGNIYEQFLGKTIRLTPSHMVKVEGKPEVKKAGGAYYTPKYIVDYIVNNTVGEVIKGKTPKQIEKIKILDPACGSGSFLLGAYRHLLDHHLKWYTMEKNRKRALKQEKILQIGKDSFQLTIAEKQRILTNNIFGVDIDHQAVEVSKLSLLLKLLEGETQESTGRLFRYTQLTLLPDLSNNIKCGNSLIGTNYFEGRISNTIDEDEIRKINPFNWEKEFPDIFKQGGFDIVIGNPPYVEFKRLQKWIKDAIKPNFDSVKGKFDLFIPFIELGIRIQKQNGCISYICPSMFTKRDFGREIRKFITNNTKISNITYFSDFQVFGKVTNYPLIFVFQKTKKIKKTKIELFTKTKGLTHSIVDKTLKENRNTSYYKTYFVNPKNFTDEVWDFSPDECKILKERLEALSNTKRLDRLCKYIFEGIASGKDEVFYINCGVINQYRLEKDLIHPLYRGRDIGRYFSHWSETWIIYPYDKKTNNVIPERKLKENFPNIYKYLINKREKLKGRSYFDKSSKKWYELWCKRVYKKFKETKIMVAEISPENRFYLDKDGFLGNTKTFSLVLSDNQKIDYKYLLGILNSKLMNFYHKLISVPKAGGFFEYKTQFLSIYPIRIIDFNNSKEKTIHDDLVRKVDKMLKLQEKYHSTRLEQDKKLYKTQIDFLDKQIDSLVYKLYELTEEEIKVVEEG